MRKETKRAFLSSFYPTPTSRMSLAATLADLAQIRSSNTRVDDASPSNPLPARALEARRAGAGPTSALGASSGIATYGDAVQVTADAGLIVPPVYIGAVDADMTQDDAFVIAKSGAMHVLREDPTHDLAFQLPPVATSAGFTFKFLVGVTPTTSSKTITFFPPAGTTIRSNVLEAGTSTFVDGGNTSIILGGGTLSRVGDYIDFVCDGFNWHASGYVKASTYDATTPS